MRRRFKRPMRLRLILLVVIVLLAASAAFLPGILKKGEEPSGGAVNAVASGDAFKGNEYHSEMYLKMDEYLKAYEGKGCFTGMVLIARGDEIILEKGYGMANYEYSVPNKPDTKFHLGSITKQFTSMAVMQLSEKGLLDVKDPLSKYIPDYPNGSKITIHQLLTHTSGIPDYINDDDTFWNISMYYHSIDSIIARFKNKKLEFKPGSKYGYSNSGYVLLAYIIEKVSGMPYESYMEKSIFAPLGMKDTGYDFCKPLVKDRASGYSLSSGRLVNADFIDSSNLKGADGLYSTAEDLHKWDSALYTEKLVSRETLNKIFTPYPPAENYGYGWIIEGSTMRHTGKMNGFYNYIGRDAKDRSVVIILSNFSRTPIDTMRKDLTAILHGESYTMPENLQQVIIDTGE